MRYLGVLATSLFVLQVSAPLELRARQQVAPDQAQSGPANSELGELQGAVEIDDVLIVTREDGTEVEGRLVDVSIDSITLRQDSGLSSFPISQITHIQQRKNGILLGLLIGAGASIPLAAIAREYTRNEAGGSGNAGAFAIVGLGTAIGIGIDAAVSGRRTVYGRSTPSAETPSSLGFQPNGFASAGITSGYNDVYRFVVGGGGGVDVLNSWVSLGGQADVFGEGGEVSGRGGPTVQVNFVRDRAFRPFAVAGYAWGQWAGRMYGAGVEFWPQGRISLRVSLQDYQDGGAPNLQSLQFGISVR